MNLSKSAQTVLVTGGGQGLGREICLQMSARCWRVAIADVNSESGKQVAEECGMKTGNAAFIKVDLGTAEEPGQMVAATVTHFGRLDVLVNCAAHAVAEAFCDMTAKAWEEILLVNVRGVALATTAAARQMDLQGGGRIINITSPASRMALPNYAAYAASKSAVDSFSRSAAVALAGKNIRVNSVSPGMMDTPMQAKTEAVLAALEQETDLDAFLAARTARIPMGRRATCQEIAAAVVWLAVEAPDYITAERLNISGGLDKD
jgi:NAD(P)-dependent dehydrogenase (short-subunit alcohol dehydrogenase family)